MGRTGQSQSEQASKDYSAQSNEAYGKAQGDISQYGSNIDKLEKGGSIGVDPWQSSAYLANQNRLQSGALNSENNSAAKSMQDLNARTGGLNTGGTNAGISSLALQKMRLANQLSAQRSASDFDKNQSYQTWLASSPLAAANSEAGLYGTGTGGRNSANQNLTQFGLQSQGFWNNLAMMGIKAGMGAVSGGMGGGGISGALDGANGNV